MDKSRILAPQTPKFLKFVRFFKKNRDFLGLKSSINERNSLKYLKKGQKQPKYPLFGPKSQIFENSRLPRSPPLTGENSSRTVGQKFHVVSTTQKFDLDETTHFDRIQWKKIKEPSLITVEEEHRIFLDLNEIA